MQKKFYRVELNDIDINNIYSSKNNNYGKSLNFTNYIHFLNVYFQVMKTNNISTDVLVVINNNFYSMGNDYLKILGNAVIEEEYIDVHKVTDIENHRNQTISISSVNYFLESFDKKNNFIFFDNGSYLWEFITESVRLNFFNDKPKRLESIFLFDSIESCNYYISNHLKGNGKIYEIELIDTEDFFEADMRIIDNIENHILFEDLINEFADYWKGKNTSNPIKEIIFQGKYKYKNIT